MIFSDEEIFEFVCATIALEKAGKRFCVDYGYHNAVQQARFFNLIK